MTTLAALVAILQSEVPAVSGVPTTAQYTQAIKDAVLDFSRRCGLAKWGELAIVSGTAAYSLPVDFLGLILLEMLSGADGVIISNTGLIPVSADWEEEYSVINKVITFTPTPMYTLMRDYKYKSGWVLTGTTGAETYATVGDEEAQIVMIKAKQLALEKISNSVASSGSGMKYSLGAVSVDNSGSADTSSMVTAMYDLHGEFVQACERYNGAAIA